MQMAAIKKNSLVYKKEDSDFILALYGPIYFYFFPKRTICNINNIGL